MLLFTLEINTKIFLNSLIDYFVSYKNICICDFQYMTSAQTKQCHRMISALLICAQIEIRLVLFDLQFHYIRRILWVNVITTTYLVSTDCCRGHAEPISKFRDQHVLKKELYHSVISVV